MVEGAPGFFQGLKEKFSPKQQETQQAEQMPANITEVKNSDGYHKFLDLADHEERLILEDLLGSQYKQGDKNPSNLGDMLKVSNDALTDLSLGKLTYVVQELEDKVAQIDNNPGLKNGLQSAVNKLKSLMHKGIEQQTENK